MPSIRPAVEIAPIMFPARASANGRTSNPMTSASPPTSSRLPTRDVAASEKRDAVALERGLLRLMAEELPEREAQEDRSADHPHHQGPPPDAQPGTDKSGIDSIRKAKFDRTARRYISQVVGGGDEAVIRRPPRARSR
jgi:hypothetical protein